MLLNIHLFKELRYKIITKPLLTWYRTGNTVQKTFSIKVFFSFASS